MTATPDPSRGAEPRTLNHFAVLRLTSCIARKSVRSPVSSVTLSMILRRFSLLLRHLVTPNTSQFRSTRYSARWLPTNPVTPVIRTTFDLERFISGELLPRLVSGRLRATGQVGR